MTISRGRRSPDTSSLHSASRILLVAALLILLGSFLVYLVYAVNLMQFPFDYDQGEGFELVDSIMFSRGQWPYQNTDTYPFYSSNYPPLFHIIAAPFVWFFGPDYWYGRLLGFLGTLITASTIAYAVYREGQHRLVAILSALAFLASNTIYHIGPLFRQHITMVLFETVAVVVLAHANEIADPRQRRRRVALGLTLVIAAGFTKQLAAITALAALAFLSIRQPRRAILWGVGFVLVGGVIFLGINLATGGQWWLQTVVANVNTFYPDQSTGLFRLWFSLHGFLIIPAVLYVIYELYFDRLSLYSLWFAATAILGGIGSGTWGAGDSYFATAITAMCILSGLFASRTLRQTWAFRDNYLSRLFIHPLQRFGPRIVSAGLIIIPLLYIGYGRAVLHLPTDGPVFGSIARILDLESNTQSNFYDSAGRVAGGYADIGHLTTQADIDAGFQIVRLIQESDKPVLSEEAAFSLLASQEVITNPTQLLNLAKAGEYDATELIAMLNEQAFGLIVLRAQFYPPAILQAIGDAYTHDQEIRMNGFDYIILRPTTDRE